MACSADGCARQTSAKESQVRPAWPATQKGFVVVGSASIMDGQGWPRMLRSWSLNRQTQTERGKEELKKKKRNDVADELVGIITVSKAGAIPKKGNAEHSETGAHSYFV